MIKPHYFFRWHLDVCTSEPHTNDVIQFDIYLRSRVGDEDWSEQLVLKAESQFCLDFDSLEMLGIPIHYNTASGTFRFGTGRRARTFKYAYTCGGGNWYWETIGLPKNSVAHVLNHLRGLRWSNRPIFTRSEWDIEFYETIWCHRGSLNYADIRNFCRSWMRADIHRRKENRAAQ